MSSVITHIECAVVRLPLCRPVHLAARRVVSRDWLVVTVSTNDGCKGIGFSYAGYEEGEVVGLVTEKLVAPFYLGHSANSPDVLCDTAFRRLGVQNGGIVARAVSALDIALWDRNAIAAGLPLYRYLGGEDRAVDTYVGGGYYHEEDGDFEQLQAELQDYRDAGYRAVKVKVGKLDAYTEGRRARICRETLGDEIDLVIDANGKFESLSEFLPYLSAYQAIEPAFFEDPFPQHRLSLYQTIGQSSAIPLSTGELLTNVDDFERLARSHSVATLQIDATACGGVTAFRRVAKVAAEFGLPLETHWFPELHAHLAGSEQTVRRIEVFDAPTIINFGSLLKEGVNLRPHRATFHDKPGIGADLNSDLMKEHTVFRTQLRV